MSSNTTITTDESYYDDVYESLPALLTITYFCIFAVAFLIIAIYAIYKLRDDRFPIDCTCSNFLNLTWNLRKIYFQAVIHTADTVSDIAVIGQFYRLAVREQNDASFNVEGLDMTGLFIGTLCALLAYRCYTAYHFFYIAGGSILLFFIQFCDFGLYLSIYLAWKMNRTQPIFWQDYITHVEALFESIPQILIQSQFVLRSGENNEIVIASIIIAFISVVTRFAKSDHPFIIPQAKNLMFDSWKSPFKFIGLYLFRTIEIVTRLIICVFLWAVLGFIPLLIVLVVTLIISGRCLFKTKSHRFLFWHIAIPMECIMPDKRKHIYFRCVSNWILLSLITIASFINENRWCLTCPDKETQRNQINPNSIDWSLGYFYLFFGWFCSFLLPFCWLFIVRNLYDGKKETTKERREEIMALPRLFYRKNGCYKPTVTPLHFAIHRRFLTEIEDILKKDEVDINAIRISGATALHSAVGRSYRDAAKILLEYGADATIIKKETWYFRCCLCKWFGRNWFSGKTPLQIAQYKVEKEKRSKGVDKLDDDHRYMQILALFEESASERTDNIIKTNTQSIAGTDLVVGNSEDAILDLTDDHDAEKKEVRAADNKLF